MFCKNCGTQLNDGVNFCKNCGASLIKKETPKTIEIQSPEMETGTDVKNPKAGFIIGMIGMLCSWIPILGMLLTILGIIFSTKEQKQQPNGLSKAGLIISIIGLVIACIITAVVLFVETE